MIVIYLGQGQFFWVTLTSDARGGALWDKYFSIRSFLANCLMLFDAGLSNLAW